MSKAGDAATAAREQEQEINQTEPKVNQSQSGDNALQSKPDVSDETAEDLLPKLLNHFHNNREELARALGLHRSTIDRWINHTSRPNNSTLLRMQRLAQERLVE